MSSTQTWVIAIGGGYGEYFFEGTEAEAEDERARKAKWEAAVGRKRLADADEIKEGKPSPCFKHPNYECRRYYCDCPQCRVKP